MRSQWYDLGRNVPVGLRVLACEVLRDHIELGSGFVDRHARPQPAENVPVAEAAPGSRLVVLEPLLRQPDGRLGTRVPIVEEPQLESRWQDADDGERALPIEVHCPADNARIRAKAIAPRRKAQDREAAGTAAVFLRHKCAAVEHRSPQHGEKLFADAHRLEVLRLSSWNRGVHAPWLSESR